MLRSLRGHLGESLATFRDVFRNPNLRRIQLAFVGSITGDWAVVAAAFRPAQAALLPSLATRPEELTAANVASSSIESVGSFAGPALGGLMLGFTSPGVVFATTAGLYLWSALNVSRIRTEVEC